MKTAASDAEGSQPEHDGSLFRLKSLIQRLAPNRKEGSILLDWSFLKEGRTPDALVLIPSAILVGVGTGLGAVVFIWLLNQVGMVTRWSQTQLGETAGLFVVMALAGLLVGYGVDRFAREAKGHGVPEVMEAIALRGGRIRPRVAAMKVLASALTIGTGGSAGREGPIVQTGSALGSSLGQLLGFSNERVRTLVACGAAAGIAATFNAPIAGSIFALEVILGRFTVRYFGLVVISSVSASIIGRVFLGDRPAFSVPAYPLSHLGELLIYILLGLLSALVAVAFIKVLYRLEGLYDRIRLGLPIKAASGMVITALIASTLPDRQVLGPGLDLIGETIAEDISLPLSLLAMLLVLKLLATSFTLGSGNSGGVFAPGLFMGAVLGGIVGTVGQRFFPGVVAHPGAYAIVGMAAVFSGAARAPMTAVLIVFEMSNDYRLILPLMLATVIATLLAEGLYRDSIYTEKLRLKGISLQQGRDLDILQGVLVHEVMTREVDSVPVDLTLAELARVFNLTHHHGMSVVDREGFLWGLVTIGDLDSALSGDVAPEASVAQIGTPLEKLVVVYPDEDVGEVLARMGVRGFGRLPVVERGQTRRLVGMIRRQDIIRAYNLALTRRAEVQHRTKHLQLRNLDGTEVVDLTLSTGDHAVGKALQELAQTLPHECVLISIRRRERVIIPHGDTVFQEGDQVTAFMDQADTEAYYRCMRGILEG